MNPRTGVYVCHCGSNIKGVIDVAEVTRWAESELPGVVIARDYPFMCSSLGQQLVEDDIQEHGLERVVVAACSPHLHERTFRKACRNSGLNPYLLQMTNIREHVSWVAKDEASATRKVKDLVAGAVARVARHVPLEPGYVDVHADTLVVGGGIAGITAALEIADAGHHVWLVEREPSIGGHMAQFDKTFPTLDCSACILTPRMNEVGQHVNVTLLTWSELEELSGSMGRFVAKIRKKPRHLIEADCTGCGICIEKCPRTFPDEEFEVGLGERKAMYRSFPQAVPNWPVLKTEACIYYEKPGKCRLCERFCPTEAIDFEQKEEFLEFEVGHVILATGWDLFDCKQIPRYGYGRLENVFTNLEFERMCNASGPTEGRILLRDGVTEPKSIGIVHCVGSRDAHYNEYCSNVCCMAALKYGHLVLEKTDAEVWSFYIDMRTTSKGYEEFYQRLLDEGMNFVRGKVGEITDVARDPSEDGKIVVQVYDTLLGEQRRIPFDMVVLMGALVPRDDAKEVALRTGIACSAAGWYTERHPKLDPVATMTDGVFVAGACQGPKDIPAAVAQGAAAAARVLGTIRKGQVEIEPIVATIDEERCSGCRICNDLCPFSAIEFDERAEVSRVESALCKGCGTCVAACPAKAISGSHFSDDQLEAELTGILGAFANGHAEKVLQAQ